MIAGFNDGGNLLAAACASRTIQPAVAFIVITAGAMAGPLIAGTAVALTIGHGIVNYREVGFVPLAAGMLGGASAILLAYAVRLPTTASVALVSATVGSLWAMGEIRQLIWSGVEKTAFSLVGSMVVGFVAGAILYTLAWLAFSRVSFRTGNRLMRLQYLTVFAQAVGYGSNDAEKMMGSIVAAMSLSAASPAFAVPFWVVLVSVLSFAAGMAFGGVRVAKTIGGKLFRIRPLHALCFQLAAATTVIVASALGGPLSTTETTASAILGTGAATNPRGLRWQVALDLVAAWFLTVPAGLACGVVATLILRPILQGA
ncbi:MAG TPA: inorganic phosphate transporter [Candidatus Acidoferrales bacterium]|nr:inorganic phosphate transporter [Candidatus Acidoferrales bacterium]